MDLTILHFPSHTCSFLSKYRQVINCIFLLPPTPARALSASSYPRSRTVSQKFLYQENKQGGVQSENEQTGGW